MANISKDRQLLVAARQWLKVLIDDIDIDPAETAFTASAVGPEGERLLVTVTLADTLADIDAALLVEGR